MKALRSCINFLVVSITPINPWLRNLRCLFERDLFRCGAVMSRKAMLLRGSVRSHFNDAIWVVIPAVTFCGAEVVLHSRGTWAF